MMKSCTISIAVRKCQNFLKNSEENGISVSVIRLSFTKSKSIFIKQAAFEGSFPVKYEKHRAVERYLDRNS